MFAVSSVIRPHYCKVLYFNSGNLSWLPRRGTQVFSSEESSDDELVLRVAAIVSCRIKGSLGRLCWPRGRRLIPMRSLSGKDLLHFSSVMASRDRDLEYRRIKQNIIYSTLEAKHILLFGNDSYCNLYIFIMICNNSCGRLCLKIAIELKIICWQILSYLVFI